MNSEPIIAVLCGGTSSEREVSLGSGKASALALACSFPTRLFVVDSEAVPEGLDPRRHVVFSTMHGTFGEDGGMQRLLDAAGIHYAGCDAEASALCFDKPRTKAAAARGGVRVCPGRVFSVPAGLPRADDLVAELGQDLVIKPACNGSSVGLRFIDNATQLAQALPELAAGEWLAERRVRGRELTVGVLHGRAMGVIEIVPREGKFDYEAKYTKGMTSYLNPAPLSPELTKAAQAAAEAAFKAAGCRDYARIDFMLSAQNELFFLEINTLPGMKDTSLLPMSAQSAGLDFKGLVRELVAPALARFRAAAHH